MPAKKDPRNANRIVPFDEAGPGVYLKLRNSGLRMLQGYYDKDHIGVVERAFLLVDMPVIEKVLEIAAWKGDEKVEVQLDDLDDFPIETIINKVRDAWSLALNGRTYMEQVEFIREEARKLTQDPILTNPAAGSEVSKDQPTAQA